jgi:hypothetical protein
MDTNEAMEFLKQMHGDEASQTTEPSKAESVPAPAGDAEPKSFPKENAEEIPEPVPEVESDRESEEADVTETKTEEVPQSKKKLSKQDKTNFAFMREKKRHKAELAERDKRIAELEAKVNKWAVLEQGDFDPNDVKSYIDHKFQLDKEQRELDSLKREREQFEQDERQREASERHARQVEECFDSDEARDHYWNLLRNGGKDFQDFLAKYDKDNTIDEFIGDSPIGPLMVSTLMRNPDVLKNIVEMRSPMRKGIALQQLENRINIGRKLGRSGNLKPVTSNQPAVDAGKPKPTKAPLPIIGSQVQNPGSSAESTKRDWNRYLAEHPRA